MANFETVESYVEWYEEELQNLKEYFLEILTSEYPYETWITQMNHNDIDEIIVKGVIVFIKFENGTIKTLTAEQRYKHKCNG